MKYKDLIYLRLNDKSEVIGVFERENLEEIFLEKSVHVFSDKTTINNLKVVIQKKAVSKFHNVSNLEDVLTPKTPCYTTTHSNG